MKLESEARFAICLIDRVDQNGLLTLNILEPVITHSDFDQVYDSKLQIEYIQHESSIIQLD